jgi:hypothetical protein
MDDLFLEFKDVTGRRHVIAKRYVVSLRDYGGIDHRDNAPKTVIELITGSTISVFEPLEDLKRVMGLE